MFVSGTEARHLKSIADRAKLPSVDDWLRDLAKDEETPLDEIRACWAVSDAEIYDRLRRLSVRTVDEESLVEYVDQVVGGLVEGDEKEARLLLGDYLIESLHKPLHADELWGFLRDHGHLPRDNCGSVALSELMRDSDWALRVQRQPRQPARLPVLERPEVATVVSALADPDGPRVVVLEGTGGSGKSSVTAAVVKQLRDRGVMVGALRLDSATPAATADELGRQGAVGFGGSPARVLAQAAAGQTAILGDRPARRLLVRVGAWGARYQRSGGNPPPGGGHARSPPAHSVPFP